MTRERAEEMADWWSEQSEWGRLCINRDMRREVTDGLFERLLRETGSLLVDEDMIGNPVTWQVMNVCQVPARDVKPFHSDVFGMREHRARVADNFEMIVETAIEGLSKSITESFDRPLFRGRLATLEVRRADHHSYAMVGWSFTLNVLFSPVYNRRFLDMGDEITRPTPDGRP